MRFSWRGRLGVHRRVIRLQRLVGRINRGWLVGLTHHLLVGCVCWCLVGQVHRLVHKHLRLPAKLQLPGHLTPCTDSTADSHTTVTTHCALTGDKSTADNINPTIQKVYKSVLFFWHICILVHMDLELTLILQSSHSAAQNTMYLDMVSLSHGTSYSIGGGWYDGPKEKIQQRETKAFSKLLGCSTHQTTGAPETKTACADTWMQHFV